MRTQAVNADLANGAESGEEEGMEEDEENDVNGNGSAIVGSGGGQRSPWQCCIKLSRDYDSEDKPLAEKPPEQLFCVVTDKAHITACVSAAQAVLLNPRAVEAAMGGPQAFVPELSSAQPGCRPAESATLRSLGDAARYELAFTSNKVVLEIDGAEADLTIIDLPGIIHDHPKGRHLVEVVERMTKTNLAPAHHIIAMALPAGLDPETQAIRLWAREVDPDGHRSIGIITKPDMISEEAHIVCSKLVKLVGARGELGPGGSRTTQQLDGHLRLGYYVVKNPSQEQLADGITFEKAREHEARYFANHAHWRPAMASSPGLVQRLGANALRSGLSALLVERIEEQMPAMRKSAREQLDRLRAELGSMPPVCMDPNHEIFQLLWRVADTLDAHAHARSDTGDRAFYQQLDRFYREYGRRAIRSTPAFLVGTTLISALNNSDKMMDVLDAGGEDGAEVDLAAVEALRMMSGGGITNSAQAEAALTVNNEKLDELLSKNLLPQRPMTLGELSRLRQRHLGRELPGFSPYSAMEELLRRFQGQWREHAEGCLQEVEAAVRELAGRTVAEELRRFPKAERVFGRALSDHVDRLVEAAEAQIDELLGMEDTDVFTLNDHYLRDTQSTFLARLKRAYLRPQALDAHTKAQVTRVQNLLGQLSSYGINFRSYESAFLAQPTPVDDELHMAASCLAYFKVAFKRIQDEVPMAIRKTLLRRLGNRQQLEAALREQLPDVAAEARGLLEEDAAVAERRRQCQDMERRLREALAVLHSPAAQL
ncbi:hypothetical protein HXX76_016195 [Chlamydomonas incerta]|uniref:GED domain-containing protein n=1 Tax=Chlamydomonas incerta TaxID=51695 RepID=A0A835S7M1_CHLIN|nr:hypothetical protein HXX76_016195 [Chlamydomonas incerta]|eukprot:KAG2422243.1 hypothetical protein HXX76_016195 [Chlamydomonas incerta]